MDPDVRRSTLRLGAVIAVAWALPLAAIWLESTANLDRWIADGPVFGIGLAVVTTCTFAGVLGAIRDLRGAIASSLLMFYLTLVSDVAVAMNFHAQPREFAGKDFLSLLMQQVTVVLCAYFASEAAVRGGEDVGANRRPQAAVGRVNPDFSRARRAGSGSRSPADA